VSNNEESKVMRELQEFRKDFGVFVTKLMGDEEQENPEGRIPRLEAGQKSLHRRVSRIEALVLMIVGAAALVKALGWIIDTAHNLLVLVAHR
jgi:hypothetical protein